MMTEEAHYDTPWEFLHRTASFPPRERPHSDSSELLLGKRLERSLRIRCCGIAEQQTSNVVGLPSSSSCQSPIVKHSHAVIRQRTTSSQLHECDPRRASSTELERSRFKFGIGRLRERTNGRDSRRIHYREEEIIHKDIDRIDAERQLSDQDIGVFLIRVRDNGTLALSIRAHRGVLHIKLELRENRWILGEGPTFGSIASIIRFYRCHELPIRGADRMLLSKPSEENESAEQTIEEGSIVRTITSERSIRRSYRQRRIDLTELLSEKGSRISPNKDGPIGNLAGAGQIRRECC